MIGDEIVWERTFLIPSPSAFFSEEWLAPRHFAEGSPILFHIHNHGSNGYSLVEFEIL